MTPQKCEICQNIPSYRLFLETVTGMGLMYSKGTLDLVVCEEHGRQILISVLKANLLKGWWSPTAFLHNIAGFVTNPYNYRKFRQQLLVS